MSDPLRTEEQCNPWKDAMREMIRSIAREYEPSTPCRCTEHMGPILATGHRHACPVDAAVRLDLARCGIV